MMVACGGAVDAAAAGDDGTTGTWRAMLACDGATLEVDREDATALKLVVRDEGAARHLSASVERARNAAGEVVVVGRARTPIEAAGSFDRFVDESGRYERAPSIGLSDVGARPRIVAEVRRSAVDRVTLAFQEVTTTRTCAGTIDGRFCRGAEWVESRGVEELASWSFEGCR